MHLGKNGEILLQGPREIEGVYGKALGWDMDYASIHPDVVMPVHLTLASEALAKLVTMDGYADFTDKLGSLYLRAYRENSHPLGSDFEAARDASELAELTREDTELAIEQAFKMYDGWEVESRTVLTLDEAGAPTSEEVIPLLADISEPAFAVAS